MNTFPTREAAEQAVIERASRDTCLLYVCKDNNGMWLITAHPEYLEDAYQVRLPKNIQE